jgi:hypothetical protein
VTQEPGETKDAISDHSASPPESAEGPSGDPLLVIDTPKLGAEEAHGALPAGAPRKRERTMTDEARITKLEHRVRELQTAVVAIVRHLGIEDHVAAAERARLGEIAAKGETPEERLLELYSTPPAS